MPSYVTTSEGLAKAKEELNELKSRRRPEISERIAKAKELGDLSENAEYHDAKDAMAFLEGRISELHDFVKRAVVSEATSAEVVAVGCRVKCADGGKVREYHIVGSHESDPLQGCISHESPLGQALMGRKAGDEFEAALPAGAKRLKIIGIDCH